MRYLTIELIHKHNDYHKQEHNIISHQIFVYLMAKLFMIIEVNLQSGNNNFLDFLIYYFDLWTKKSPEPKIFETDNYDNYFAMTILVINHYCDCIYVTAYDII